jgi:uncharacterized protein DUF4440
VPWQRACPVQIYRVGLRLEMKVDELIELEHRGWQGLSGPDGAGVYQDLMADDGVMVFGNGVMAKKTVIASIRQVEPWTDYRIEDARVVHPSPDIGVVVCRATAHRPGQGEYAAWMSSVYVRIGGDWRLLVHQQTPITN